jgi:hypothetical protein
MPTAPHRSVRTLGLWSATLCTVFSLAYVLAQLAEWVGLLGSSGGPHSRSTAAGLAVLLTPSLLLSVAFVALTVAVHSVRRAAFAGQGIERWIRWSRVANGCLVPFLALQMYYPALIRGGALWAITFPAASWLLAIHFRRTQVRPPSGPSLW